MTATAQAAPTQFAEIASRRWVVRDVPFRHCVIPGIFTNAVYESLVEAFRAKLDEKSSLESNYSNYDARIVPLTETDAVRFPAILNAAFLKLLSKAMGLQTTLEFDGALHSHPPGSRNGWIHNDYNPGWFARPAARDEVLFSASGSCNYRTGKVSEASPTSIQRMRYLTALYYLDNPEWQKGMGGETGIYDIQSRSVDDAIVFVPPVNNSLLLFECTPHSWHSFRSTRFQRNSLTFWLHRPFEEARQQWPGHEPVYWT